MPQNTNKAFAIAAYLVRRYQCGIAVTSAESMGLVIG
jgi:hypothetical protein